MGYDIFVSYSTQDKLFVDALVHRLEERHYRCWYAPRDISAGMTWPAAISRAIKEIPLMLLVFSASSNKSEEISRELTLASANKCIVIPVRIENVLPSEELEYHLSNRHWLDVYGLEVENAITQIMDGLRRYADVFANRESAGSEASAFALHDTPEEAARAGAEELKGSAAAASGDYAAKAPGQNAGAPLSTKRKSVRAWAGAGVFLVALLLGGALYWHSTHPAKNSSEVLVEAAPSAGIYRYTSQVEHVSAFCLRLTPPTEPNVPEEYLVALTGIGGPFEGKIFRCKVQFTNSDMRLYTDIHGQKFVLFIATPANRATLYVPDSTREYSAAPQVQIKDPATVQAFISAFQNEDAWNGVPE